MTRIWPLFVMAAVVFLGAKTVLLGNYTHFDDVVARPTVLSRLSRPPVALNQTQKQWIPCIKLNEASAATLDPTLLEFLQSRKATARIVNDYYQLHGQSRSALYDAFFDIPRVIHQVWVGPKPPPADLLDTWRQKYIAHCPGWNYTLWTDTEVKSLKYLNRAFADKEELSYAKADIIRAAILYEHGGIYIDADSQWVNKRCLDDVFLLASSTGFIAALEPGKDHLANGVIAVVKHHPVIREYMAVQLILSTGGRGGYPWQRLGPVALTTAVSVSDNHELSEYCNGYTNLHENGDYFNANDPALNAALALGLNSKYFYPTSWLKHNFTVVRNTAYVDQLVHTKYPQAIMYQLGFSTHT